MSESATETLRYLATNPRMIGVLFLLNLLVVQSISAGTDGGSVLAGP